jgi:hypothetical protein
VNNNDFNKDIILKLYSKYKYQSFLKGPKPEKNKAFLKDINGSISDHLYDLNLLEKKGYYVILKKKQFQSIKRAEISKFSIENFSIKSS